MDDPHPDGQLEPPGVPLQAAGAAGRDQPGRDLDRPHPGALDVPPGELQGTRRCRVGVPADQGRRAQHDPALPREPAQIAAVPVDRLQVDPVRDGIQLGEQGHQRGGRVRHGLDPFPARGPQHPHRPTGAQHRGVGDEGVGQRIALPHPGEVRRGQRRKPLHCLATPAKAGRDPRRRIRHAEDAAHPDSLRVGPAGSANTLTGRVGASGGSMGPRSECPGRRPRPNARSRSV